MSATRDLDGAEPRAEAWWVDAHGVLAVALADVSTALRREDGVLWLDVPTWSDWAREILTTEFGFHGLALTPLRRAQPHPADPLLPRSPVRRAARAGDRPVTPDQRVRPELRHRVLDHPQAENMVADLARQVGLLEQKVMASTSDEPQRFLTELFTIRHELMTVRTMSSQGVEIFRRAIHLADFAPAEGRAKMKDLLDQDQRVSQISGSQLEFLAGVTEFYRARTDTKMTIAAERLAVIAAVTLPITAVSSMMGMNVIVNSSTHWVLLIILLLIMLAMSLLLLRWTKRQGWW